MNEGTHSCNTYRKEALHYSRALRQATAELNYFLSNTCRGYWTWGGCFQEHGDEIRPTALAINFYADRLETRLFPLRKMELQNTLRKKFQCLAQMKHVAKKEAVDAKQKLLQAPGARPGKGIHSTPPRLPGRVQGTFRTLFGSFVASSSYTTGVLERIPCQEV